MSVKIQNAAIDVFTRTAEGKEEETIILRGVLDVGSLQEISVDKYQREVLGGSKIRALMKAMETSTVPDIELGMRGEKYRVHDEGKTYHLQDPVFVIDGLQRITAAMRLHAEKPELPIRIGTVVHFNTDVNWERERFRVLNQERTRLNVNVSLRNMCADHPSVEMISRLCVDNEFVLNDRVQWSQVMQRRQIISGILLCRVAAMLHTRFGPGRSNEVGELAAALDKTMEVVGRTTMRDNVKTFFDLIDECFSIKQVVYGDRSLHLKNNFLVALADVLARHKDFWRGNRLFIDIDLRRKIGKFPITDPSISHLAGAGSSARPVLVQVLIEHVNSGKRTRRLTLVDGVEPVLPLETSKPEAPAPLIEAVK